MANESEVRIITYADRHKQAFSDLNLAWISKYFTVEEIDRQQLSRPVEEIIEPGGQIFMAEMNGRIIGTVAMIPGRPGEYELAKMAVTPNAQGHGIGGLLIEKSLRWAREHQARSVMLLSNRILGPAIHLYEKFGFTEDSMDDKSADYNRCDITMRLHLQD